jgi:hypothetical protein
LNRTAIIEELLVMIAIMEDHFHTTIGEYALPYRFVFFFALQTPETFDEGL